VYAGSAGHRARLTPWLYRRPLALLRLLAVLLPSMTRRPGAHTGAVLGRSSRRYAELAGWC
jgi:hypothetical protein